MMADVVEPICRCGHAAEDHDETGCNQTGYACVEYRPRLP
jgi:hypothetical protein